MNITILWYFISFIEYGLPSFIEYDLSSFLILGLRVILRYSLNNYLHFYYDIYKKRIFLYIIYESPLFEGVLECCVKNSLVLGLERLIINIYHILHQIPNTYNYIVIEIIILSYYFQSSEIPNTYNLITYLDCILYLYIGFIIIICLAYKLINSELKVNNPLIYYILIWVCIILLFILAFLFFVNLNKLILTIFKIMVEKLTNSIVNMMARGPISSGNQPGGFGQPVGGGGKPPRKPEDPILPKGHYNEDEDAEGDTDYEYFQNEDISKNKSKATTEPSEVRDRRLDGMKERYKSMKSKETPEQRRERLNKNNLLSRLRYSKESQEHRNERLKKNSASHKIRKSLETAEQRRRRLDSNKESARKSRLKKKENKNKDNKDN